MANRIYPKYKKACMTGGANVNLLTGTVKALLVNISGTGTLYTYNDAHEFLNSVPSGARVSTTPALTGKIVSDLAVFDSDDPIFPTVTGDQSEGLILFIDTGVEATSRLVMYQDTAITGAPITPTGVNIRTTVDVAGWFTL